MTFSSDTKINYHLFQKFKLIKKNKFNHLPIILTGKDRGRHGKERKRPSRVFNYT